MKKKWSVLTALTLCAVFATAPLNVSAYNVRTSDRLVIETEAFQYNSGIHDNAEEVSGYGGYLNANGVDANFMITGVFIFESGYKYYTMHPINEINEVNTPDLIKAGVGYYPFGSDTRGDIEATTYLDTLLDGRELVVGDLVKFQNYFVLESYPMHYGFSSVVEHDENGNELIPSAEYVGNVMEMFGEDFRDVLVNEMYLAPNYCIGSIGTKGGYELIDNNHVVRKGDVMENGEIGMVDVLATNQYLLGVYQPTSYGILAADVNRNGAVEDVDSMMLLKSLVGLETLE